MEDAIDDRDHHGFRRTDKVDPGVWMFPRGIAESLTDRERRAVHWSPDNGASHYGAGTCRVALTGRSAAHTD
jgi:hypothetical protein